MRSLLFGFIFAISAMASAQTETSSTVTSRYDSPLHGLSVDFAYANLTRIKVREDAAASGLVYNGPSSSSWQIDGITLGYKSFAPGGVGFDGGFAFLTNMDGNMSRDLDGSANIYQLFGNANYSFSPNFYFFAGGNLSQMQLSSNTKYSVSLRPGVGYQAGFGFRKNNFNLQLGYLEMTLPEEFDLSSAFGKSTTVNATFTTAGFMAKAGLLF